MYRFGLACRAIPVKFSSMEGLHMFCPQCKTEYREGFYECADCGVPLVDVLPKREEQKVTVGALPDSDGLTEVYQTTSNFNFITAAKMLEEAGIPFCGRDPYTDDSEDFKTVSPIYAWTILTPGEYAGEAVRILDERMCGPIEENDVDEIAEETEQIIEDVAPHYSSRSWEHSPIIMEGEGPLRKIILFVIIAAVFGAVILLLRK
jgi:hypothetical protein